MIPRQRMAWHRASHGPFLPTGLRAGAAAPAIGLRPGPGTGSMEYVTVGSDSVWSRLGSALEKAGSAPGTGGAYPGVAWAHPVFFAVEQVGTRWRILGRTASPTPQEARDELAHQFLLRASQAAEGSREQQDYRQAADLLDRERHDRLTVVGRVFAVARAEQALRTGPDGPEPPRPGDNRLPVSESAGRDSVPRFIGDADTDVGPDAAALRAWLRDSAPKAGTLPEEVIADERRRHALYPQVVLLLGNWFAIGEHDEGGWHQAWIAEHETPADARESLLTYFRQTVPRWEKRGAEICAAYASAAGALERGQADRDPRGGAPVPDHPDRAGRPAECRRTGTAPALRLRPLPAARRLTRIEHAPARRGVPLLFRALFRNRPASPAHPRNTLRADE